MTYRRVCPFLTVLTVALLGGCGGLVSHQNQPPGVMQGTPRGLYAVTSHVPGMGPFSGSTTALMAAKPTKDGFRANSRPGAAAEMLGGVGGFFLDIFGDKRAPGGAFLHWVSPAPREDGPVRGTVRSPRANLGAELYSLDQPVELRSPSNGQLFGLLTVEPASVEDYPTTDFEKLVDRIDAVLAEHLFDPNLYKAPGTQACLRHLRRVAGVARDDAEFVVGWFFAARHLEFSHLYLDRKLDPQFEDRFTSTSFISPAIPAEAVTLTEADGIATLRIRHFDEDSADAIDAAFTEIAKLEPRGLIIDLRDNPGGTFVAARVAAHLIDSPADAGVFFTRQGRAKVLAGQLEEFPAITWVDSVDELLGLLDEHGAIRWRVEPVAPRYAGVVAVLINGRVASAAEALVAGLRELARVTLVGEPTPGAMLSGQYFDLGQGWKLFTPTADYRTAHGVRVEGRGVLPDIKAKSEDAPRIAREFLATFR
ncbi:MAG: S41 family peptidase [Planctomycetota bacterium]